MAITIDATAGGSSSNSYATLAQANTYYDSDNFPDATWNDTGSITAVKTGALILATRQLDQLDFSGTPIGSKIEGATDYQALSWPRRGGSRDVYAIGGVALSQERFPYCYDNSGNLIIPKLIREACIIQANYLLSSQDSLGDPSNRERMIREGLASVSVPGLSETYSGRTSVRAGFSPDAIRMIGHLIKSGGRLRRA